MVLSKNELEFPENPSIGTILIKDQILYSYIKIGGLETWYPFASKTNSYIHVQGLPSSTWVVNHNLETEDIWFQVKNSAGEIVYVGNTIVNPNQFTLNFTTAITGTVVVVAPDTIDVPAVKASLITVGNSSEVIIDSSGVRINGSYALTAASIEVQIAAAVNDEAALRIAADATKQDTLVSGTNIKTVNSVSVLGSGDITIPAYVHPTNHPPSIITQDADNRFVTDVEKAAWNAKQPAGTYATGTGTATGTNTGDQTTITGNAGTATQLETARAINGVAFDGTSDIVINAVDATARVAVSSLGVANGVATLGSDGKVPAVQLPSYVDDIIEGANQAAFPITGEVGKIYVSLDTNKTYRWSGSAYVYITSGAVDSVAGKTGIVSLVKADVGLGNVDNTADSEKPVSTAQAAAHAAVQTVAASDATTKADAAQAAAIAASTPASHAGAGGVAHAAVTTINNGFMLATDKVKLDSISTTDIANQSLAFAIALG